MGGKSAITQGRVRSRALALQAPQLWRGIAEHLAKSSPEVLVLIHPIHMTPTSHSQRALSVGHLSPLHDRTSTSPHSCKPA